MNGCWKHNRSCGCDLGRDLNDYLFLTTIIFLRSSAGTAVGADALVTTLVAAGATAALVAVCGYTVALRSLAASVAARRLRLNHVRRTSVAHDGAAVTASASAARGALLALVLATSLAAAVAARAHVAVGAAAITVGHGDVGTALVGEARRISSEVRAGAPGGTVCVDLRRRRHQQQD